MTVQYSCLPAGALTVDPAVQRSLVGNWSRKLTGNFNPNSLGTLTVSARDDGTIVILDGQHRHAAALAAGHKEPMPCIVHSGLSRDQEAAMFIQLNDSRRVDTLDRFRIRVVAGDPAAVELDSILRVYGWKIAPGKANANFAAVGALEAVYNGSGVRKGPRPDMVRAVLATINNAWGLTYEGTNRTIVAGLGVFYARHGVRVEQDKVAHELTKVTPNQLIAKAAQMRDLQGGSIAAALAKVVTGLYNKHRRQNRLADWIWTR